VETNDGDYAVLVSCTRYADRLEVVTLWRAEGGYHKTLGWTEVSNDIPKLGPDHHIHFSIEPALGMRRPLDQ
jgi:hypothetical protein